MNTKCGIVCAHNPLILQEVQAFLSTNASVCHHSTHGARVGSLEDEAADIESLKSRFGDIILPHPHKMRQEEEGDEQKEDHGWYDYLVLNPYQEDKTLKPWASIKDNGSFLVSDFSSITSKDVIPVSHKNTSDSSRADNGGQKIGLLYSLTLVVFIFLSEKRVLIADSNIKKNILRKGKRTGRRAITETGAIGTDIFQHLLLGYKGDAEREFYFLARHKVEPKVWLRGYRDLLLPSNIPNQAYNDPHQILWNDNNEVQHRTWKEAWNYLMERISSIYDYKMKMCAPLVNAKNEGSLLILGD